MHTYLIQRISPSVEKHDFEKNITPWKKEKEHNFISEEGAKSPTTYNNQTYEL